MKQYFFRWATPVSNIFRPFWAAVLCKAQKGRKMLEMSVTDRIYDRV